MGECLMAIFCTIYYICSYIQTVPQVIKLIKTKSSNDYSLWQVFLGMAGLICWSIYIFTSSQAMIVYIGTIIDLVLEFLVVGLILAFFDFKRKKVKVDNKEEKGNL
ncbi:MAG: PQ-loop repeat-containing protein [Clostridiales bacterium]|nr:PQ-loop repeat-containing protein [Clostridiales bacterium]